MMKSLWIAFVAAAFLPISAAELNYGPDSEEWKLLYDPPFKKPGEVPKGSELRKELFDLARPKLEKLAKQPLLFSGSLKAYRNWALFTGVSVDKAGNEIAFPEDGNSDTVILWIRTVEGWKVVDFAGGHSDVFYEIWPEQYGMPLPLLNAP